MKLFITVNNQSKEITLYFNNLKELTAIIEKTQTKEIITINFDVFLTTKIGLMVKTF